ncbi:hypothetical protein JAAARDRAFT_182830 [Jaapia argillacea MUCL 33604]|uniref:Auxin efflux carrier n=1 Tax=Jaapia argillacea MUCL 33604 TaxID=933084 RepID=A0A067PFZ1_9AGAM|nr:hypothetical protein JAAARDRAFT_182830 [Jaapia argillacea MUCL 33604]
MPLIKMFLAVLFGYILARKGLFPAAASRGASQVTMSVSLPCLIFSNIVPAFTPSNASAIGPLLLLAYTYQFIGFFMGLVIREIFFVPRNFWTGIVVMCGTTNSIVMTVTTLPPFDPSTDPALGVSFVSIFIVTYHITFWVFGAARSLAWDYLPGVPQGEDAERKVPWSQKPIGGWISRVILRRQLTIRVDEATLHSTRDEKEAGPVMDEEALGHSKEHLDEVGAIPLPFEKRPTVGLDVQLARQTSRLSITTSPRSAISITHPRLPSLRAPSQHRTYSLSPPSLKLPPGENPSQETLVLPPTQSRFRQILGKIFRPLAGAVTPITLTLAISLPIALITPLKALFVDTSSSGGPSWHGPDGRPPLAFVMDTADFLGTIAVPLALVVLGASFARLRLPRPLSRLPIAAMLAVSVAKLFLLPIIGIFVVQALVKKGLISQTAIAERFVAMLLSGTPAAINQLIVSQLYSPDGECDTLSAFLLVQYALMFLSSSALTAVSLLLL